MAITDATLMVETSHTKCSACNEGTDPAAVTHATAIGYGRQYPTDGCGARFAAISTNTTVSRPEVRDAIRGLLRAMRPDLPIVDAYDGQGIAGPAGPTADGENRTTA